MGAMTEPTSVPRPRQVTVAGVAAVVGCVLLVVALFDAMAQLRSIEMRDTIEDFLSTPPGNGLGISDEQVRGILRVLVLVNGGLAATATVLAVYALQRHKAARLGLTVAAVIMLFTAPVSGGFLPVVVAVAATAMWTRSARDWFDGRPPRGPEVAAVGPHEERPPSWPPPDVEPSRPEPPATDPSASRPGPAPYPFGQPGGQPVDQPVGQPVGPPDPSWAPPAYGTEPGRHPAPYGMPSGREKRPATVTIAAVLTWLFASVTAVLFVLAIVVMSVSREQLVDTLREDPDVAALDFSTNDLLAMLWVVSAVVVFWCLSAIVLAVLAFRRVGWARIVLAVSAGITALITVPTLISAPFALVVTLAAVATVVLLFVGGANAWYARRPERGGGPGSYGGPGTGSYGGPPQPPYGQQPQPPQQPSRKPPVW
jgi:hypothetical protein